MDALWPSPFSLPVRPAVGPVRGHAGPAAQLSVSAGARAPPPPCAPGARPPLPQDGWTDREGEEGGGRGMAGDGEGTNEYIYIDEYEYEEI